MTIRTRLTERLSVDHPIILAPMGVAASGCLASAVTKAGGLGLVGVGYRGKDWIKSQLDEAGNVRVGVGFITWLLERSPELLDVALSAQLAAICLSFGDPRPFAEKIRSSGVPLICQVQSVADSRCAVESMAAPKAMRATQHSEPLFCR
jgi:nitronate monooxygenase